MKNKLIYALVLAVLWSADSLLSIARAQSPFGNAVNLDGVNQYVSVPIVAGSAVNSPLTIEARVFVRTHSSWSRLMDFGNGAGFNNIVCALTSGTSGQPSLYFFNGSGAIIGSVTSPAVLPLNTWTHLAFTYDGTNGSIYINGNLAVKGAMPVPPPASRTNNFIGQSNFGDTYANAIIDEFRIWSVARTPAQINGSLGAPLAGNEAGLLLYYKFDSASGTVATNSAVAAGAAYNGTLVNSPAWVPDNTNAVPGTWTPLASTAPGAVGLILLLPDSTVMANVPDSGNTWFRLTPDIHGSYVHGSWTNVAPSIYNRYAYGSDVLLDGRLFVVGGEYGTSAAKAEIYSPVSNIWTDVSPPPSLLDSRQVSPAFGFGNKQTFSDCNSKLLPSGNVLITPVLASVSGGSLIYNPTTNGWSQGPRLVGSQSQDEAAWVKLPDDSILSIDPLNQGTGTNSERYIPASNTWVNDNTVPVTLWDPYAFEIGPPILLPNGKAFFIGSTPNTAIYTPSGTASPGTWTAGPVIPNELGAPDAPVAMMVDGKVLCALSPTPTADVFYATPTYFYTYDYLAGSVGTFTQIPAPTGADGFSIDSESGNFIMLDLPDGTVLMSSQTSQLYVYNPTGPPLSAGKPTIQNISVNGDGTLHLSGTLFNGISEGSAFGDENQNDSNYPLVRFTDADGTVRYARSYNWSRSSVATGSVVVTTECTVPPGATLPDVIQVVANGIASDGVVFNPTGPSLVTSLNDSGNGSLRQVISNSAAGATITFFKNLSGGIITLTSGELLLNKNLTIDASSLAGGISINGGHASRICEITSVSANVLKSLTLTNGYAGSGNSGGAILNAGSLGLNQCTLTGNTAVSSGGAIQTSGTLNMTGCTLVGNSSQFAGAMNNAGTANLQNCTFSSNTASAGNGGAIDNTFSATLSLLHCTFYGNSASGVGGGIDNYLSQLNLTNTIIAGNTTGVAGPDIYNWASSFVSAGGLNIVQSLGGSGTVTNLGTVISINPQLAPLGNHGGPTQTMPPLPGSPAIDATPSTALATDQRGFPRVVGPFADIGAVEFQDASPIVTTAANAGIGSLRYASTYTTNGDYITFSNNLSGATILLTGPITLKQSLTIDGLTLTPGVAINGNHAGSVFNVTGGNVVLTALTITNGNGLNGIGGGGIYNTANLTVNKCTLAGNSTPGYGGGIENDGGVLVLNQCTLAGNSCSLDGGGAIDISSGSATVNQSTLTLNHAPNSGGSGGIYNNSSSAIVFNSIVAGNTSPANPNTVGPISLTGANLTSGNPLLAALGNHGGPTPTMPPLPGSPAIDGCPGASLVFTDQRGFPSLVGPSADIGAVEFQDASPIVTSTANSGIGSLRYASTYATNDAYITFSNNLSGATILLNGPIILDKNVTVDGSSLPAGIVINGNQAGTVFNVIDQNDVVLTALTITNAHATNGNGGGIYNEANLTVNRCTFAGNSTLDYGGGIENYHGSLVVNQSTFSGNSASLGGGIFSIGTLEVNESTVTGNNTTYDGGGIENYSGSATVFNSIVAGNTSPNTPNASDSINLTGTNLTDGNPLLASLGNYGGPTPTMPPLPGSPAVDAASTTSFATDQRGLPRPLGLAPDIGAVEGIYNPAGPGKLTSAADLSNGSFRFAFTNYTDASYTVLASTNLAAALNTWSKLGSAVESPLGSGLFSFTDPQATNNVQRYYCVRSP